jgi:muramoyltetrapeptide carboxypeptidase LdcA involved in peptidoglycan recycling
MIYPKFIKENSTIGIPAPSSGAYNQQKINQMLNAKKNLESLGYNLILSENLLKCHKARSASSIVRAIEINDMITNKDIDMILCATGGEFLVEILPYINFDLLKENPKFFIGFSDPTGLLYPITTKYDIATIYGHNFSSLGTEKYHKSHNDFLEIIKGNIIEQQSYDLYEENRFERKTGLEEYNLTEKVYWNTLDNKEVSIKGRIIGGCLDVIAEIAGTKYDGINFFNEKYKDDGIIWYFDNCELSMEETIRTLWRLSELDYFKYTKGIIFGRFGQNITHLDYDVRTCLEDSVISSLNIPIIYDADISHKGPSLTIINGSIATIKVKEGKSTINFELK